MLDHIERYLELEFLMPGAELRWVAPGGDVFHVQGSRRRRSRRKCCEKVGFSALRRLQT